MKDDSVEILRAVDKLRKIGEDEVKAILTGITGSEEKASLIIRYITSGENSSSFMETLSKLESLSGERTRVRSVSGRSTHFLKKRG